MPFSSPNETVLHYERSGAGEALVLVRAPAPASGTIHDDVADLAGLIEGVDLQPAHLAGASGSGSIALRLAHDPQITHHDSYIEALEGFATGVTHG
jgi:pimeloyl-ACP methyl ester carboxylesterase